MPKSGLKQMKDRAWDDSHHIPLFQDPIYRYVCVPLILKQPVAIITVVLSLLDSKAVQSKANI